MILACIMTILGIGEQTARRERAAGGAYYYIEARAAGCRGGYCLPLAYVWHRQPRLPRGQRFAPLQQLDGDQIRRADEGHVAIARRSVDRDTLLHEVRAGRIDVLDLIRQMAEIAPAGIALRIPVVGELDLRGVVTGGCEKHQREATLLIIHAAQLAQPEGNAIEAE